MGTGPWQVLLHAPTNLLQLPGPCGPKELPHTLLRKVRTPGSPVVPCGSQSTLYVSAMPPWEGFYPRRASRDVWRHFWLSLFRGATGI